jgi:hypothetical protein
VLLEADTVEAQPGATDRSTHNNPSGLALIGPGVGETSKWPGVTRKIANGRAFGISAADRH